MHCLHALSECIICRHPIHETLFASGGNEGSLFYWLVGSESPAGAMETAHDQTVWSLDWHPLGHILASGSNDKTCKFWTRNMPDDPMDDRLVIACVIDCITGCVIIFIDFCPGQRHIFHVSVCPSVCRCIIVCVCVCTCVFVGAWQRAVAPINLSYDIHDTRNSNCVRVRNNS
jgi:hypothetical protein